MQSDYIIIVLSFFEGLALIISPCILPILPIILAGSLSGGIKRPLGIITGFIITFTLFTFFSRQIVLYSSIDLNLIRHISYAILLLLGVVLISSTLFEKFNLWSQRLTNTGTSLVTANNPDSGFFGGMLFGGLISIIWTPCAGPILAAVIVQTILQQSTLFSFFALLSFSIGVAVPMFLIAIFGRDILARVSIFKTHSAFFRKLAGLIIIACVGYIINLEYGFIASAPKQLDVANSTTLIDGLNKPYPAPSLDGADTWINTSPLNMQALKGKVVLIDFWTYSCINCIRTLPYIKGWYAKYHDKGLVIIGIHAPEFEFEKDLANVQRAVTNNGIFYPVALDNHYNIWHAYNNHYWPAQYLIDKNGNVVYTHFGEGNDEVTENNIRYLLNIHGAEPMMKATKEAENLYSQTPETYFGYARAESFASPESIVRDQPANYSFPTTLWQNAWALQGNWTIMADKIISKSAKNSLKIHFYASHVYMVAGNRQNAAATLTLTLNGKALGKAHGKDVVRNQLIIDRYTLYELVSQETPQEGTLTLTTDTGEVELYTFTFG